MELGWTWGGVKLEWSLSGVLSGVGVELEWSWSWGGVELEWGWSGVGVEFERS